MLNRFVVLMLTQMVSKYTDAGLEKINFTVDGFCLHVAMAQKRATNQQFFGHCYFTGDDRAGWVVLFWELTLDIKDKTQIPHILVFSLHCFAFVLP